MRFAVYLKGDRGVESLNGLLGRSLTPVVCVSEQEDRRFRVICDQHSLPLLVEDRPKRAEHMKVVHDFAPDLIVCAGYSKLLPLSLFSDLKWGAINCHGGRLPEYRGASPVPWQIMRGETWGVAYVLRMTEGVDDGPILAQEEYTIEPHETARHITNKVSAIFNKIIPDVVEQFSQGRPPEGVPQNHSHACHWTRRTPADGLIPWQVMSAEQVVNFIRALDDPYPGAFLERGSNRVIVTRARVYSKKVAGVPGRCVGKSQEGLLILARDNAVEILECRCNKEVVHPHDLGISYGETFMGSLAPVTL